MVEDSGIDTRLDDSRARQVLVVEDMVPLQEYIAETLQDLGVEVTTADDGLTALEQIDARPQAFDLIVSDITMPRMDGMQLLTRLRERHYPAPFIVLTAHGQDDLIVRFLKAGACDYLIKPVGIEDLMMAATMALERMPGESQPIEVEYDPQGWFEISGGSDYSVLYRYRKFLGLLDVFKVDEDVANELRLALEELGRNGIEWGNKGDTSKRIRLGCRILPYKIIIQIADEGDGFDPDAVPDPSLSPFEHIEQRRREGKRLGGYGIHLIRSLMDKVTWNARGNVVVAIKYLKRHEDDRA